MEQETNVDRFQIIKHHYILDFNRIQIFNPLNLILNKCLLIFRILDNLTPVEYSETLNVIEEAILATDLALHFKHLASLKMVAKKGPTGKNPFVIRSKIYFTVRLTTKF